MKDNLYDFLGIFSKLFIGSILLNARTMTNNVVVFFLQEHLPSPFRLNTLPTCSWKVFGHLSYGFLFKHLYLNPVNVNPLGANQDCNRGQS